MKYNCFTLLQFIHDYAPVEWEIPPLPDILRPVSVTVNYVLSNMLVVPKLDLHCRKCKTRVIFEYDGKKNTISLFCPDNLCVDYTMDLCDPPSPPVRVPTYKKRKTCLSRSKSPPDIEDGRPSKLLCNDLDTFFSVRKIVPDEILKAMVRDGIVGPDAQLKFIDNNDQCDKDVFLFRVSTHLECSYCHFNSYVFEFSRREMRLRAKCVTCDCLRRHTVIEWTLVLNPDTDSWVEAENKKSALIRRLVSVFIFRLRLLCRQRNGC